MTDATRPVRGETIDTTARGHDAPRRSVIDDVRALADDGRTYVHAELGYQKKRAGFVFGEVKQGAVFAVIAVVLVLLALIGFTVGLILTLAPLLTMFGATLLVTVVYLGVAYYLLQRAKGHFRTMSDGLKDKSA